MHLPFSWDLSVIPYSEFAFDFKIVQILILRVRYFYPGTTFAITEVDGVRIVSSDVCDLIQKVPGMDFFPMLI